LPYSRERLSRIAPTWRVCSTQIQTDAVPPLRRGFLYLCSWRKWSMPNGLFGSARQTANGSRMKPRNNGGCSFTATHSYEGVSRAETDFRDTGAGRARLRDQYAGRLQHHSRGRPGYIGYRPRGDGYRARHKGQDVASRAREAPQ
jgi:hypothetical protein